MQSFQWKAKQGKCLGIQHRTRVLPALRQQIHVELTFADVIAIAVQALQENISKQIITNKFIFPLQRVIIQIQIDIKIMI